MQVFFKTADGTCLAASLTDPIPETLYISEQKYKHNILKKKCIKLRFGIRVRIKVRVRTPKVKS